jgi:hypothetical protein
VSEYTRHTATESMMVPLRPTKLIYDALHYNRQIIYTLYHRYIFLSLLDGTIYRIGTSFALAANQILQSDHGRVTTLDLRYVIKLPFWIRRILSGHQRSRSTAVLSTQVLQPSSGFLSTLDNSSSTDLKSSGRWRQQRLWSIDTNNNIVRIATETGTSLIEVDVSAAGIWWPSALSSSVYVSPNDNLYTLRIYIGEILGEG